MFKKGVEEKKSDPTLSISFLAFPVFSRVAVSETSDTRRRPLTPLQPAERRNRPPGAISRYLLLTTSVPEPPLECSESYLTPLPENQTADVATLFSCI